MIRHYTEDEILAAVEDLTRPRLVRFVSLRMIEPVQSPQGAVYREVDLARLRLLVDLVESYEIEDDALSLVIGLVDQLHGLRAEMATILRALAQQPPEIREKLRQLIEED